MANLQPKRIDETAISNERDNAPTKIDNLGFGKMFAQVIEQLF